MTLTQYMKDHHGTAIAPEELPNIKEHLEQELTLQKKSALHRLKKTLDLFFDMDIAHRCKEVRYTDAREVFIHLAHTKGYTQNEIASELKINRSTVSHWQARHHTDLLYAPRYRQKHKMITAELYLNNNRKRVACNAPTKTQTHDTYKTNIRKRI